MEESAKELEETIRKEAALKKALQEKEAERMDIEEKYSTLQDEAAGKTRYVDQNECCYVLIRLFSVKKKLRWKVSSIYNFLSQIIGN